MADGKLRLWYAPSSPYVRKAHIALHETGLIERTELRPVVISPLAPGDELPPLNPLGNARGPNHAVEWVGRGGGRRGRRSEPGPGGARARAPPPLAHLLARAAAKSE